MSEREAGRVSVCRPIDAPGCKELPAAVDLPTCREAVILECARRPDIDA